MGCEDHPEKCPRGKPQNGPVPPGDVGWGNQTLGTRLRELLAGGIRPLPPSCGWQRSVRYRLRRLRSPRTQPSPQVQPCLPQGPPKAPKVPKATKAPKVPEAPKAPKVPKAPEAPKAPKAPKAVLSSFFATSLKAF